MKKILLILSILLLFSLPISILPCYISNVCKWWMNFLGAFLYLIWFIWTILGYILYNLLFYIWKNNKTYFEINFYKKSWFFIVIYLLLLISFLILPLIYEYFLEYWMEIIVIIWPYLLLYLLIIPIIIIWWKSLNKRNIFIYIFIIFLTIIWWFYLSNNYIEKKENEMQKDFDTIFIWNCKNIDFDNFDKSVQATLKVTCNYNKIINENWCEIWDWMCINYFCNWNKSIKAFCSNNNICKCN